LGTGPESTVAKLGDLKLRAKANLVKTSPSSPLGLAVVAQFVLPTGSKDSFVSIHQGGTDAAEFTPTAVVEYLSGQLSFDANLGYTLRSQTFLGAASIDDRIDLGLGGAYTLSKTKHTKLQALFEGQAFLPVDLGAGATSSELPVELRAGGRYQK